MIYVGYPDGTPVFGSSSPSTTKHAEHQASRNLGADWRDRGYRVFYGDPPPRPGPVRQRNPRTRVMLHNCPKYGFLTDWHAG